MPDKLNIKSLYRYFAGHPEASWIMIWPNALDLYRFIKTHEIHNVLDLGTGIGVTASVVALAMQEKGEMNYHIDSIEQFDKCVDLANKLIPGVLKQNIKVHKATPVIWNTEHIPYQNFSTFDKLPDLQYDLIINDGPGPFLENGHYIDMPNGTIQKLLLEGKIKPGAFVIYDGRITSLKNLDRFFGNNFYLLEKSDIRSDFHVLEKKDIPLEIGDDGKRGVEMMGYFNNPK